MGRAADLHQAEGAAAADRQGPGQRDHQGAAGAEPRRAAQHHPVLAQGARVQGHGAGPSDDWLG